MAIATAFYPSLRQIEPFLRIAQQVDKDRNVNVLIRPEQFAF